MVSKQCTVPIDREVNWRVSEHGETSPVQDKGPTFETKSLFSGPSFKYTDSIFCEKKKINENIIDLLSADFTRLVH